MNGSKRRIDASLKAGEVPDRAQQLRELLSITSVRAGIVAALTVAGLAAGGWLLTWRADETGVDASMGVIARSVNVTRKLYAGRAEFGAGSVMTAVLRTRPYDDQPVKIRWSEGGALDVRNHFGGRVDVVALRDHFEVHYGSVPASVCAKLVLQLAHTKMPVFINTIYFAAPAVAEHSSKACYAEANNIVLKFR